jgi:GT2 family glycosyltransferase
LEANVTPVVDPDPRASRNQEAAQGRLAVVVVNFNTHDRLRECLRSLSSEPTSLVIVADNGSTDESVRMVEREFPWVIVDVDATNPGYGAAANRAIRRCAPRHVLVLNSDTRVQPDALARLQGYLDEHPRAGVIGPRLTDEDGTLQRSCFPFPSLFRRSLTDGPMGILATWIPALREPLATWAHHEPRVVPWVMGAAMVLRREAFDAIGGFDESYFMYAEETDLCYRLKAAGWETHFTPVTDVVHAGRASTDQHRAAMLEQNLASSFQFYRRHYHGLYLVLVEIKLRTGMAVLLARDALRYALSTDPTRRAELAEDIRVWKRATLGRLSAHPSR